MSTSNYARGAKPAVFAEPSPADSQSNAPAQTEQRPQSREETRETQPEGSDSGEPNPQPSHYLPETTPIELLILIALAHQDLHGLGLIQDIYNRTENTVLLVPGTLYVALKRMVAARLIIPVDPPEGEQGNDRRRYYHITEAGRDAIHQEISRMERLAVNAREALTK